MGLSGAAFAAFVHVTAQAGVPRRKTPDPQRPAGQPAMASAFVSELWLPACERGSGAPRRPEGRWRISSSRRKVAHLVVPKEGGAPRRPEGRWRTSPSRRKVVSDVGRARRAGKARWVRGTGSAVIRSDSGVSAPKSSTGSSRGVYEHDAGGRPVHRLVSASWWRVWRTGRSRYRSR